MMLILHFLARSWSRWTAQKPSCLFKRALRLTLVAVMGSWQWGSCSGSLLPLCEKLALVTSVDRLW
jgi:hypothetical protein